LSTNTSETPSSGDRSGGSVGWSSNRRGDSARNLKPAEMHLWV
jgi:hypothetical protein